MAIFGAGLDLGLVLLLALALVDYAKLKVAPISLGLTSVGALLFLSGGSLGAVSMGVDVASVVYALNVLGTVAAVVGLAWAAVSLALKLKGK